MHDHSHDHAGAADYNKAFALGIALNLVYVAAEAASGVLGGSVALLADAGHNLSDVVGLLLAWAGHALAMAPPTTQRTYGWRGTSILAALFNALILLVALGAITTEAIRRFAEPAEVAGGAIILVAGIGVVVNTATALLFISGRKDDVNIRGAFLHMAADAGVSVGVVVAGVLIQATGRQWIDPVASLLIAAVVFVSTWGLLKDSINLAVQAVPRGIDPEEVAAYLRGLPGVSAVHDLHIWAMSTTETALTVHLVKPTVEDEDALLEEIHHELAHRFRIGHITVQIERNNQAACRQAPDDVV
ncbi:MAG: cation transporter [Planctomycetales bacterium]|nr:cation transporter [Planctomycetales bacterium]